MKLTSGVFQDHNGNRSSMRVAKILVVVAILIVWVHSCLVGEPGTITPIPPSILGLLFICMGIGSVEKYVELVFGGNLSSTISSVLKSSEEKQPPKEL